MIERWLQITCDNCGETDNSTAPNMTAVEFLRDLRQSSWRKIGSDHACSESCAAVLRVRKEKT